MAANPANTIDKSYISSINFLDKRDILNKVLDVTNEDTNFLDIMEQFKRKVPTSSAKFHHFVNKPLYTKITGLNANWSALPNVGNGSIVTVTTSTGAAPAAQTQEQYYINDITNVVAGGINLSGTANKLVGTEVFVVTSNAHGEGSGAPTPVKYGLKKYEAKAQIFKKSYILTDIELANKIEVEFNGQAYYMYKAQNDALSTFNTDISTQMMWGEDNGSSFSGWDNSMTTPPEVASTNVADNDGNAVQFTRGLHDWSIAEGFSDLTAIGADTGLVRLSELTKEMNVIRCPNDYMMILGTDANIKIDNDIKGLNVTTNNPAGHRLAVDGNNPDFSLDKFTLYGRNWTKMWMPMIDHETGQAYLGADNSKYCYFIPNNKIKVVGEDGAVDRLRVRYLEGQNTSFGYRETKLGALAPVPTDARSVFECIYESSMGLQVVGAEHFGVATF